MRNMRNEIYNELLVIKCKQGDDEAFDELVGLWQKRLWHYALRVTGSESSAWDVLQETWYAVIKGFSRLEDVASFPAWIFRILNNKCNDWLRKQQRRTKLRDDLEQQCQNNSDCADNEKTDFLNTAIAKLSADCRALLMLRYREDFDISQIAEVLNIPEGTVKSRLHRTIEKLRQLMERN
jgi:RNA polymerase sigma-70 factor (ECF subfamily)